MPDGLEGERVDAAIARMFGFSRTKAAELAAAGKVLRSTARRSASPSGCTAGPGSKWSCRGPPAPVQIVAEPVDGMEIVHDDDDIVVIVKPIGVAAHPSPGWSGTDRHRRPRRGRLPDLHLRRRRAPGHRAPPGRRHLRPDGRGQVRVRVQLLKQQFRERTVDKRYHALVAGPPGSRPAAPSTPPSGAIPPMTTSGPSPPRASRPSPTTTWSRRSARPACSTSSWRPGAPTRSGCTCPPTATPASAT